MSSANKFYVYVYFDPSIRHPTTINGVEYDSLPFYVGKGCRGRFLSHLRAAVEGVSDNSLKMNKIRKMLSNGVTPTIIKVAEKLSADDALIMEANLIKQLGTRILIEGIPTGPLTNVKSSGTTNTKTASPSEATRTKMSATRAARWQDPQHRDTLMAQTLEQNKKLQALHRSDPDFKQTWLQRVREAAKGEATREKKRANTSKFWNDPINRQHRTDLIRASNQERWDTPEFRDAHIERNKNKWRDPEYRQKMINSNTERWKDPVWAAATRQKISETKNRKRAEKEAATVSSPSSTNE